MDRVGVRELRQNLSVYLRRVRAGEALEVTEHGHPVAVLAPLPARSGVLDRLVAGGRATPALEPFDDLPPPCGPRSTAGTRAIEEQRQERL